MCREPRDRAGAMPFPLQLSKESVYKSKRKCRYQCYLCSKSNEGGATRRCSGGSMVAGTGMHNNKKPELKVSAGVWNSDGTS